MSIKATIISFLLLVTGVPVKIHAQVPAPNLYVGLEGTYGVRALTISSDIAQISQSLVIEQGASLGVVFGNEFLRTKLRIVNSDYTAMSYPRTVKLFQSEGQINFYPLEFIRTHRQLMDVYLLGGLNWDAIKFYGHFHDPDNSNPINYSNPHEPYLGKVTQWSTSFGVGVEYHVLYVSSFLHVFAEIKYGSPLLQYSDNEYLSQTSMGNFSAFTLGMSFGLHR